MSQAPTTPPSPSPPPPSQGYYGGGGGGLPPVPAPNAELIVYLAALLVVGLVAIIADTVAAATWVNFAMWVTAAYLVSRGLAKLRNVTER
jgi:hypothetical protein